MQIHQLPTLTNLPAAGDLLPISSNEQAFAIDYNALAKALLEQYAGTVLGGSAKTLAEALLYGTVSATLTPGAFTGNTTSGIRFSKFGRLAILQYNFNGAPTFSDSTNHNIIAVPSGFEPQIAGNKVCTTQSGKQYLLGLSTASITMNVVGQTIASTFFRDFIPYICAES